MTNVSESQHSVLAAAQRNCSTAQGRSRVARWLHERAVLRGLVIALMLPSCVIPPSLDPDTRDAGANSAPAIISVRADNIVPMEEYRTYTFERGLGTLNLTVHDTDVTDTLTCKVFVNYNNPDKVPARATSEAAGTTVQRSCTLALGGLCQSDDIGAATPRLMQVLVFDKEVLENGEEPLYQAMALGGLSTSRTYFLRCVEPQQ